MSKTPASLLERVRHPGDQEAWERFVDLYTPLIGYWARRAGLSSHEAADLVQDVLTTLVRKMPEFSYDHDKSFRGWLRTVTLNTWRQRRRKSSLPLEGGGDGLDDMAAPDDGQALAFEEAEYRSYLVSRAFELMRSEFQPTTLRAYWENVIERRPAADVAHELGISLNAVYVAKSRVLRKLHQELDGLFD